MNAAFNTWNRLHMGGRERQFNYSQGSKVGGFRLFRAEQGLRQKAAGRASTRLRWPQWKMRLRENINCPVYVHPEKRFK